jgi:prolyl oligopeptidase
MTHRLLGLLLASLLGNAALAADTSAPPTPVRTVNTTYHGTVVPDPYRWMEDMAAPEFKGWMKVQSDHSQAVLGRIGAREALRQRLAALAESSESVGGVQRIGDTLVYLKAEPGRDQRRLFLREGVGGTERLLLDPLQVPGQSGQHSIDFYTLSPDKQWLALGLSSGGTEASELRVMRVADASLLPDRIDRAGLNETIAWLPDSRRFFYNRLPTGERYNKSAVYLHTLGQPVAQDAAVFGWKLSPKRRFEVPDLPTLFTQAGSPWVLAEVQHGDAAERSYYVVRQSELRGPATPWRRIVSRPDAVKQVVLAGDAVYALSHRRASHRELLRIDPASSRSSTALPAGGPVLRSMQVSRDALYVEALDGGVSRVLRVPRQGAASTLALPLEGLVREITTDLADDQVWLRMESWARPAQWFAAATGAELALQKPPVMPPFEIAAQRVMVRSHDGVMVPLSILHKKGLVLDGARPTILSGYGAYGISMEPRYNPQRVAWLERGGVIAVAHVRGGGEFGEDWHKAGWILTKQNTVSDFIACAQYLIDQRYTQSAKLAGTGGSAGGLTIGGAITQRPELFGVAQSAVGLSDLLRAELTPNGPPNIAEFGTVTNPKHFKAMYALSPYHRVRDGVNYPAVIVTTGANDPRVDAWEPGKMAARLQAATASGKPVLLRVDFAGGHGMGSGRSQWVSETADVWSFFLWQMGETEFQPQ